MKFSNFYTTKRQVHDQNLYDRTFVNGFLKFLGK